jgi:hypothetical protein
MVRAALVFLSVLALSAQAEACRIPSRSGYFHHELPANVPGGYTALRIEVVELDPYTLEDSIAVVVRARVDEVLVGEFNGAVADIPYPTINCYRQPVVGQRVVVVGQLMYDEVGRALFMPLALPLSFPGPLLPTED